MNNLHVLYTVNNKYIDIMLASIYSLINNSGYENITLHIVEEDFVREDYHKIVEALAPFSQVAFYFYPLKDFNITKFHIPNWRGSQIANARLFFQSILHHDLDNVDNLLYLDADTLVVSNLMLEEYQNNIISASYELGPKTYYNRLKLNGRYFNSGVLFFNVAKWQDNNLEELLMKGIKEGFSNLQFPDQDIFNIILKDYISALPLAYNLSSTESFFNNFLTYLYFNSPLISGNAKEVQMAKENPKIIHAYGLADIKPWTKDNLNPYKDVWFKYLQMVNENYQAPDLEKFQNFFNKHPYLLVLALFLKNSAPVYLQDMSRSLAKKINLQK